MLMKNRSCSHQQPKAKFHHFLSLLPRQFSPGVAAAVRITAADCLDGFTVFSSLSLNKSQAPRVYTETGFACCDRSSSLQCLRRGTKSTVCPHSVQKYTPKFVWRWYETAAVCSGAREPVNLENTSLIWLTKSHINLRWTLEYFFADDEDFVVCPPISNTAGAAGTYHLMCCQAEKLSKDCFLLQLHLQTKF